MLRASVVGSSVSDMAVPPAPVSCLQRRPSEPSATDRAETSAEIRPGDGRRLACHRCSSPITDDASRIGMGGAHAHHFVNPDGIEFHVGCFAAAGGCAALAAPSTYWTWFPGFSWQVELCAACGEHLGWLFRSADAVFHGLVLTRLVEVAEDGETGH
jgi:hypothetical protein